MKAFPILFKKREELLQKEDVEEEEVVVKEEEVEVQEEAVEVVEVYLQIMVVNLVLHKEEEVGAEAEERKKLSTRYLLSLMKTFRMFYKSN